MHDQSKFHSVLLCAIEAFFVLYTPSVLMNIQPFFRARCLNFAIFSFMKMFPPLSDQGNMFEFAIYDSNM